jgi:hypothetical protein
MTTMIKELVAAFKEHQAQVICGALAMNGAVNVYQTYLILNK